MRDWFNDLLKLAIIAVIVLGATFLYVQGNRYELVPLGAVVFKIDKMSGQVTVIKRSGEFQIVGD